ncbi:helix-turn-helix domain-containing protein [Piscinibacter gummiphilus]|uniref:helix-turn-helix domain-containing protein n=1 Tax=Piscinibacter gummiphilus TaxID=946333 RepID=UPI0039B81E57
MMENPNTAPAAFTMNELCEASGASPRRIRYYVQQALLPPPVGKGRAARYSEEHLFRLQQLLPLSEQGMSAKALVKARAIPLQSPLRSDTPTGSVEILARQRVGDFLQILIDRSMSPLSLQQERELLDQLSLRARKFISRKTNGR